MDHSSQQSDPHLCRGTAETGDRLPAGNRVLEPGEDFVLTAMIT